MNYLRIIRPVNLGIIILTQLLLRFCVIETFYNLSAVKPALSYLDLSLLILSTVLIAAGGYIINDYYDQEIDTTNKPDKLILGKSISIKNTIIYYWIVNGIGVSVGFYLAIKIDYYVLGYIFPVVAIMLWLYSSRYQKTVLWGNLMIAALSAMVILVVWLFDFFALKANPILFVEAMKQFVYLHYIIWGFAGFAFLVSLVREVVKDIEDREGDMEGNYRTLPVVYGVARSKSVAIVIHSLAMILLAACQLLLYNENLMLVFWYLTIAVQLLFIFVLYYLVISSNKKDFHFLSNAYKLLMIAGILTMQLFYITY